MLEDLKTCPLCNSGHFNNYLTCKDHTVSKKTFDLVRCNNCNFIFTNPRPKAEDLYKYYQSQDYVSHSNKSNNPVNFIYKIARNFTLKRKVRLINSISKKGKILDVGCGTGHFINACQQNGWAITGVEPDKQARKVASDKTGQTIADDLSKIDENNFDVISMWHVLEHVSDLNQYMRMLVERLKENGKLIVAVPNHKSNDAIYYKADWAAYDVPRHLYHFDQNTMNQLANKYGLKVAKTLPMKLDSYYVSLLSETYQGSGLVKYIKAIYRGFVSNIKAKQNQNNYSSLIYIISK